MHKKWTDICPLRAFSGSVLELQISVCSFGPNIVLAVENIKNIIAAVYVRYSIASIKSLNFKYSFNDHNSNDVNKLFKSLPSNWRYYAASVPGSFYCRIFPTSSIHLEHLPPYGKKTNMAS